MNPELAEQIIAFIRWALAGAFAVKEGDATNAQYAPIFEAALAENRPLTAEEWAPIESLADAAHQGLQGA